MGCTIVHAWREKADSVMQAIIIGTFNVLALHDINYRLQIWTFAQVWWRLMAAFIWVWSNGGIELLAKACSWSLLIITERHWFTSVSTPIERILLWALLHASGTLWDACDDLLFLKWYMHSPKLSMKHYLKFNDKHYTLYTNFQNKQGILLRRLRVISICFPYLRRGFPSLQHCLCLHSDPLCGHSLQRSPHHTQWSLACRLASQCATSEVLGERTTAHMVKMNNETYHMHECITKTKDADVP